MYKKTPFYTYNKYDPLHWILEMIPDPEETDEGTKTADTTRKRVNKTSEKETLNHE